MPSLKTTTPISRGKTYHIFNRGINSQQVYFTNANYHYFLKLLQKYLSGYCQFLSYCLMPNHYHLIVRINDFALHNDHTLPDIEGIGKIFINQLRRLIISYTKAINKQENRHGAIFDARYKRLEVTSEEYLKYLIFYCHYNPEKHGVINNFRNYSFSSYHAFVSSANTQLSRQSVIDYSGGVQEFIEYHKVIHNKRKGLILEE